MMNEEYLIYCKKRNSEEKFGPLDLQGGEYGVKRIYASLFEKQEDAIRTANSLAKQNPGYEFQVRQCGKDRACYKPEA